MSKHWFHFLFFVFAGLELASQIFNLSFLHLIAKPMLVISLGVYYHQNVPSINKMFLCALLFCWLGDVLLMFDHHNEFFFMTGLGSFLIAHILLILSYRIFLFPDHGFKGTQRVRLSFPIILAGSGLVVMLYPRLGNLKIPVVIYALALTLMVVQSVFRLGRTSARSFWYVFLGAVFFMISDSLLAINKFYQPLSNAGVLVMTTYMAAVYLIVQGMIAQDKKPAEIY